MTKLTLALVILCGLLGASIPDSQAADKMPQGGLPKSDAALRISKDIRFIYQDRAGNFWFGMDGGGVCRYAGRSFACFTEKEGLCSNFVRTISEDKAGHLWFNTRDGVCRYDGKSFTRFADEGGPREGGSSGKVVQGEPENLWFGTNGGVYHYDGRSFTYFSLPKADAGSQSPSSLYLNRQSPYSVYSMLEDKAGNLWFGTEGRGVCRYDGKSCTYFAEKGLGEAAVRSIFQDKAGNLWFGNNGGGAYRYDGRSLTNFTEENGLSNPDFLKTLKSKPGTLARVWTIAEDQAGTLWFGTIDAGAWRYDGKSLTHFTVKDGLCSDSIWTLYKDRAGTLWFGTDKGVCRYDGKVFVDFATDRGERPEELRPQ